MLDENSLPEKNHRHHPEEGEQEGQHHSMSHSVHGGDGEHEMGATGRWITRRWTMLSMAGTIGVT